MKLRLDRSKARLSSGDIAREFAKFAQINVFAAAAAVSLMLL